MGIITKGIVTRGIVNRELRIGDSYQGGFYAGIITVNGDRYQLIVSAQSTEVTRQMKNSFSGLPQQPNVNDGLYNTQTMYDADPSGVTYPAAYYARTLTLNGYSDWYIPSRDEMEMLYRSFKPSTGSNNTNNRSATDDNLPTGTNENSVPRGAAYTSTVPAQTTLTQFQTAGAQAFSTANSYWSSSRTVPQPSYAWVEEFIAGGQSWGTFPDFSLIIRPVRRVFFSTPAALTFTASATQPSGVIPLRAVYDPDKLRLIAVGGNAIFYTSNGTTWTAGTYNSTFNQAIFCRKLTDNYFYTGHLGGFLRYSTTGIDNYTDWTAAVTNQTVYDITLAGSNYVLLNGGVYTSSSRGGTWTLRLSVGAYSIARNPTTGRLVVVSGTSSSGNLRIDTSDDNGISWTQRLTLTPSGGTGQFTLFASIDWYSSANSFIVTQGWLTTGSAARGEVWKLSSDATSSTNPLANVSGYLTAFGNISSDGYVSGFGGRVYRTTDNGNNWTLQTTGTSADLSAVTYMPSVSRLVINGYQTTTYLTGQ